MENLELRHHGVKGMKWGVRKKSNGGTDDDRESASRKVKKGKSAVKKLLAISGAVSLVTLAGVYGYKSGKIRSAKELHLTRRVASIKGKITKAANKAARSKPIDNGTRDLVNASLSKLGRLHIPDIIR